MTSIYLFEQGVRGKGPKISIAICCMGPSVVSTSIGAHLRFAGDFWAPHIVHVLHHSFTSCAGPPSRTSAVLSQVLSPHRGVPLLGHHAALPGWKELTHEAQPLVDSYSTLSQLHPSMSDVRHHPPTPS